MVGNHQTSIYKWLFGVPGWSPLKFTNIKNRGFGYFFLQEVYVATNKIMFGEAPVGRFSDFHEFVEFFGKP